jgi:hypothetical protein
MKYKNGNEFEGEWNSNGKRNGQGTMKFANNDIYKGCWENDHIHGTGMYKT